MTTEPDSRPEWAAKYPNLASPRFGTEVVAVSDEFFAAKERLIQDAAPIFIPDKYDDHGKWMDGWESRRRRDGGHDWCIVNLGVKSRIVGVEIDTSHFTGNYPPRASLEAARELEGEPEWTPILPAVELDGDNRHFFAIAEGGPWARLRLNIHPDGGVARLRVFGEAAPDWETQDPNETVELSALSRGGRILAYNDSHYGDVKALLSGGRGATMGDGWETRRRREPGHDWIIIALGRPGLIEEIEIDTAHFKGNFPDRASLQAGLLERAAEHAVSTEAMFWDEILAPQKLSADSIHRFDAPALSASGPVSHVKLNIFPDGGVSRLRVFGKIAP